MKISPEIAIGRKSINNSKLKLLQSLKEGDWFGERSLYIEGEIYLLSYQSRSFCEILYLSSLRFKRQCQLHLTKLERESLEKFLHERQHHHSIEHENRPHSESSEENENPAEGGHKNAEENDENNHGNTVEKSHIIQSSGIELNSLEKKQDIGKKIQFPLQPQVSDIDNSDSDSTFDGPSHTSGSVIVSRKQRRVALQLGASIKFEETNYITVWFHPESKFMIFWRLLVAFAVLYYMFAAPLLLSASFDHNILRQHTTLFVFCYLTDLVMMTNLIMSMFFFPFLKDGIIISKAEAIFEYYRSSHYVFLDVFALLPYDLLAIYFGANFIPILRLPRLYLVLQTTRYLNELKGFSEASEKGQFLVLVWWLYMLIHWFGCLFILSARMSTRMFGYETNWIEVDQQSDVWSFDHTDFNNLALYFRSIYWALYVTSSAGYYDILPTNPFETVVATFIMLYGCQMVVGLLGGVSSVVETLTSDPISFQTKLENTQALAARKGLSVGIREKLACYFQYNWERCRGVEESQVLANLPLPLRQGVIKEITGAVLRKIVFFQDCSDGILNAILASLQPRIFIDGDSVVTAGKYSSHTTTTTNNTHSLLLPYLS